MQAARNDDGNLLTRTTIAHPRDHLLDMRDRRFLLDAVAEIEDQPAVRKIRQYIIDRAVERCSARDQR